jgi:nucleoside-diphosphate-sugar epimerase
MNEKILITGGAGYVGSVMTDHLLNQGYEVTVLDNLMHNQQSLLYLFHHKKFNFIHGDVRNPELLRSIVPKFDFILPLAAIVGAPLCEKKPEDARSTNYEAIALLNKIRDSKRQKIIFPMTDSGYGSQTGTVHCTEETPLAPVSLYGQTKVDAEKVLMSTPNTVSLRLATAFGSSFRLRTDLLINYLVLHALRDNYIVVFEKNFHRNFIHVRDIARAFQHTIENFDSMKDQIYNIGDDSLNMTKEELVFKIKEHIPSVYLHFADIGTDMDKRNYTVSNKKIAKTGFKIETTIDDGIEELKRTFQFLERNYSNV